MKCIVFQSFSVIAQTSLKKKKGWIQSVVTAMQTTVKSISTPMYLYNLYLYLYHLFYIYIYKRENCIQIKLPTSLWSHSSVVKCLPSAHKAHGSIQITCSPEKRKQTLSQESFNWHLILLPRQITLLFLQQVWIPFKWSTSFSNNQRNQKTMEKCPITHVQMFSARQAFLSKSNSLSLKYHVASKGQIK